MAAGVDYKRYRRALTPATASGINSAATTEPNFLWKQRKYVLLQATLAATVIYSAGMSPPGGLLPDNGDVLQVTYPHRYKVFFYFNATAFVASLVTIHLLLFDSLSRCRWWLRAVQASVILNQFSLLGAFAAGSCREVAMSTYAVALVGMVSPYLYAHVLSFLRHARRTHHGCKNLAPPDDQAPETVELVPNIFLIISPFLAMLTYQAGLSTPCSFLSDSKDGDHLAGDPLLRGHHPDRFMAFFYFNLMAFVASLATTMLITSAVTRTRLWLWVCTGASLIGLTGAFAIGSSMSVKAPINVVFALVAALTLYMVVHSMSSAASHHRVHAVSDPQVTDADQLLAKSRTYLLLLGILAATVTYQAGLNPPGGFWQQNAAHDYIAGDPILGIKKSPSRRYLVFFYCNATAFVASLVILILLVNTILSTQVKWLAIKVSMILDILGLVGAFVAGSCRKVSISVYILAAVLAVTVFLNVLMLQVFPNRATWWKMVRERLKQSVPNWLKKFFELPPEVEGEDMKRKLEKSRKHLLLLAILAASLTYEAGLSPPGGFWQQNKTGHVVAGDPVLINDYYRRRYTAFFYCNAVAFVGSLVLIMLLLNRKNSSRVLSHALRVYVILDQLIRQTGGFVTRICREVSISIYVFILVFAVVVCIALHGILDVPESIPGSQQILLFLFTIMEEEAGHVLPPTTVDGPSAESQDLMVVEIESEHDKTKLDGDVWVLDCSAQMHYTADVQLLDGSDALPSFRDDDAHILARGHVRTNRFEVPNVSCVRGDARNVISVAQLARSHGLVSVFEPTVGYVRDTSTGKDVGRAYVREGDGVYVLEYLLIGEPQDIVDASVSLCTYTDEMQSGVSEVTLELPDRMSWFGMSRLDSDSAKDSIVANAFPMLSPYEEQGGTRTKQFYMDSGVCHHMTWNGDALKAYHGTLNIKPPVESVMGTRDIRSATRVNSDELSHPLKVGGIGYIDSTGGSLDGVLFVPGSDVNLVSVNQVTRDYSARVVFHRDEFWIEKLESKERIGHGQRVGDNYVVAVLDVGAATSWVLDSSAWIHHTSNRQMLYDFQEAPEYLLPAPAGVEGLHILGHGSVRTQRFKVPGIRYIASSGDARNVISVAQLADDHGFVSTFEPGFCYVKDKVTGQIVGVGHLLDGVYVLKTLRINQDKGRGSGLSYEPRDDSSKRKRPGRADTVDGMTTTGNLESLQTDRDKCFLNTSTPNHHASNQKLLLGTGSFQETADDLLQRNVVSVAQLASRHGLVTVFEPTGCYMQDKKTGQIVAHGHLRDGAFILDNLLINQEKGPGRSGAANKQREQAVDSSDIRRGQFVAGKDQGIRNQNGGDDDGNRDKGRGQVRGEEGGDKGGGGASSSRDKGRGQARGEGEGDKGGGGTNDGRDEGRGGQAGGEGGGDRDGAGSGGGGGGGKKGGGGDEEKKSDKKEEIEETKEENDEGEDEEIEKKRHQQSSHGGLLSHLRYESFCPCGASLICEKCGLGPPKACQGDIATYHETIKVAEGCVLHTPMQGGSGSPQPSPNFIMDSGAHSHMTWNGDPGFLKPYPYKVDLPIGAIKGVGGKICRVSGCGYINTDAITLEGVLHVPDGGVNLVSLSKLVDDYSARVVFDKKLFSIKRLQDKEMIGNGHRVGSHYFLDHFLPGCLYVDQLQTTQRVQQRDGSFASSSRATRF